MLFTRTVFHTHRLAIQGKLLHSDCILLLPPHSRSRASVRVEAPPRYSRFVLTFYFNYVVTCCPIDQLITAKFINSRPGKEDLPVGIFGARFRPLSCHTKMWNATSLITGRPGKYLMLKHSEAGVYVSASTVKTVLT